MEYTKEQELETALIRLLTGINKKSVGGCNWYDGILDDAKEEALELIKRNKNKMEKLKEPKGRVKCFNCGEILDNNEIQSNIGLLANSQEEFYCDNCCGDKFDNEDLNEND